MADDAVVEFDRESPVAVEVVEDGGTSGVVDLRLGVREAVPDDAIGIEKAGDTGRAQVSVRLVPVGPGSPIDGTCGAGAESGAGYDAVLAATCSFDSLPVNVYTVDVTVDGGYYMAQAEDALTVYDTSLGFTT
ncbi:MAG: hypothetical protein OER95_07910, partial [Acidimicrobiia bacterium]|nr:hypothetical protein [Acidimicrobiia bacterium]